MKKKYVGLILIICILIIIIGFMFYSSNIVDNNSKINVGKAYFSIPKGYHVGSLNSMGDVNLSNGNNSIFLKEYPDDKIIKYMDTYIKDRKGKNESISLANCTVNNTLIYKSTNNVNGAVHYWFVNDNKTYSIYTLNKNDVDDDMVYRMISNVNS